MFKFSSLLSAALRSNLLIDIAVETKNSIVNEIRTAAIALFIVGFGSALFLGGLVMFVALDMGSVHSVHGEFAEAFAGTSLGAGFLLTVASGMRLKRAIDRLNTIKDTLSAKGALDAATRLASASVDLAKNGAANAQELARSAADSIQNFFRKDDVKAKETADSEK